LTSCDYVMGDLCVMSFGRVDGESFLGLRSAMARADGLHLLVNQEPFSCQSSSFDPKFIYCTGPLLEYDATVFVEALSHDDQLIASGTLMVSIASGKLRIAPTADLYTLYPYYIFISILLNSFMR